MNNDSTEVTVAHGNLKEALRRRFRGNLPIGLLFIFLSLPLGPDQAAGVPVAPFDPLLALLGISLLIFLMLSRLRPERYWFLLDALWFLLAAIYVLLNVYRGDGWWLLIFIPMALANMSVDFSAYRRFGLTPDQRGGDSTRATQTLPETLVCPICSAENPIDASLCSNCRYSLGVE